MNTLKQNFIGLLSAMAFWNRMPKPEYHHRERVSLHQDPYHGGHSAGSTKMSSDAHFRADKREGRRIWGLYNLKEKRLYPVANPVCSMLVIPELRKRRSERDPEALGAQIIAFRPNRKSL